jgi:molybdate transport system substrate-binding protein
MDRFRQVARILLGLMIFGETAFCRPVTILAAASLTDVLPQIETLWKAQGGKETASVFDGSSRLAKQIEQGAPADVFFSADTQWMDYLAKAKKIDPSTRKDLLSNDLVLIAPSTSSFVFHGAADLRLPQIKKIALAGENVPVSRYAKAALEKLGLWNALQSKIVRGDNVRVALHWVASSNSDAGIVYRTDALTNKNVRVAYLFPSNSHPKILYSIAVTKTTEDRAAAAAFVEFCGTKGAQEIFQRAGFVPVTAISE